MTHSAWQAPPDGSADDDCAAQQKQSNPVSAQRWVNLLNSGSNAANAAAQCMGERLQHRTNTE
jgi:hypothetical protein